MADSLQLRGGVKSNIPALGDREPGFTTDTHELYVGYGGANYKVGGADVVQSVESMKRDVESMKIDVESMKIDVESMKREKLSAAKAAAQGSVASDAELPAVIDALNNLISALKTAGIMNT